MSTSIEKVETGSSPTRFTGLEVAFGYFSVSTKGASNIAPGGAALARPSAIGAGIGIGMSGAVRP